MLTFNNLGNLGRLANQMFQYAALKGIARNREFDFSIPPEDVFGQTDLNVRNEFINLYNTFPNIKCILLGRSTAIFHKKTMIFKIRLFI